MSTLRRTIWFVPVIGLLAAGWSCGNGAGLFNPAFVNTFQGGVFPLTPGPRADFVLVRTVNETPDLVTFIVTIERRVVDLDAEGNPQFDDVGNPVTSLVNETVRLNTVPGGRAAEMGVVFPCDVSPVTRVGLGENLLPSDAAAFVGGGGPAGSPGFGIPVGNLNPLDIADSNFNCGDTIIFRAIESTGVTGGIALESFLLPGSEQPSIFNGPNTFVNLQSFLESQIREDVP